MFVRHGGTCIRVHYLRLRKVNNAENMDQHVPKDDTRSVTDVLQGQEVPGTMAFYTLLKSWGVQGKLQVNTKTGTT